METIIRPYHQTDRSGCVDAFKTNVPQFFTEDEITDFENFLVKLESGTIQTRFYVVEENNTIIGCGGFGDKDNTGAISLAWGLVHKDFHKKGFGEKLLSHRLEQIKKYFPGVPVVLDTTQYSYGFFEKYGFVTTKITNDFYATGMHRYDMVLNG